MRNRTLILTAGAILVLAAPAGSAAYSSPRTAIGASGSTLERTVAPGQAATRDPLRGQQGFVVRIDAKPRAAFAAELISKHLSEAAAAKRAATDWRPLLRTWDWPTTRALVNVVTRARGEK